MIFRKDRIFWLMVAAFLVYAGIFIWQTSFSIGGQRYFCLADDAMISMTYARNLAHGQGLVWNPGGQRVEGYSNFLWVIFMSLFHLGPLAPAKISLAIQICGAFFLLGNLFIIKKISDLLDNHNQYVTNLAVILTAFFYPLNYWGLRGMETSALALIMSGAVWLALKPPGAGRFSPNIYWLLAVGILIRTDFILPALIFFIFLMIYDVKNRRAHLLWGLPWLALPLIGQTGFRLWYYGDILPNTYYLKMTGFPMFFRITRGIYVFWENVIWAKGIIIFFIPAVIFFFKKDRVVKLLFAVFLAAMAYNLYIGGDGTELPLLSNRFLCPAFPLFFIMLSFTTVKLVEMALFRPEPSSLQLKKYFKSIYLAIVIIILLSFNPQLNLKYLPQWLLIIKPFETDINRGMTGTSLFLKIITRENARITVASAGVIPYFLPGRFYIDILGKNDRVIARQKMKLVNSRDNIWTGFSPGHMKWDYGYSVGYLKPDVLGQIWQPDDFFRNFYYSNNPAARNYLLIPPSLVVLKNSPSINWEKLKPPAVTR